VIFQERGSAFEVAGGWQLITFSVLGLSPV